MESMKCRKCGAEFTVGIFCPECGTKYEEPVPETKTNDMQFEVSVENAKQATMDKEIELLKQKNINMQKEHEIAAKKKDAEEIAKQAAMDKEIELQRQKNITIQLEQEIEAKKREELTRTFNGKLYDSIEEMETAKAIYEEEKAVENIIKRDNRKAIWSFILGILVTPLVYTLVLWLPALIVSIVFGCQAIKANSEKKIFAILGLVFSGLFILLISIGLIVSFIELA